MQGELQTPDAIWQGSKLMLWVSGLGILSKHVVILSTCIPWTMTT